MIYKWLGFIWPNFRFVQKTLEQNWKLTGSFRRALASPGEVLAMVDIKVIF